MNRFAFTTLLLLALPFQAISTESVDRTARLEYEKCMRETRAARAACTAGCGNILASCYERQISIIQADSEAQLERLKAGRCTEQAEKLANHFDVLKANNDGIQGFHGTWSGFELAIQTELLKNRALQMLAHECAA